MGSPEKNKSIPLLILGHAHPSLHPFACVPLSETSFPADPDLFFLLCAKEETELSAAIDALKAAHVPTDQILIAEGEGLVSLGTQENNVGCLEILAADSPEELRQRLITRIEMQRHRKLFQEIENARVEGLPSALLAEDWQLRLETAHLTHAFCCALDLSASRHGLALRTALRSPVLPPEIWPATLSFEQLLPHCAQLALRHWQNPVSFREELRRYSTTLPFRVRTDLRNVAERCLESIWKGLEHVA